MLKILKVLRLTHNPLLNNTFWTSHYSNRIFTGPWNLHVARPVLKSKSSVFTLRPQFASLQRIIVLSTRKLIWSLLKPSYSLFSTQIILTFLLFILCSRWSKMIGKEFRELKELRSESEILLSNQEIKSATPGVAYM